MSTNTSMYTQRSTLNAGQFNKRITIYSVEIVTDEDGFQTKQKAVVLKPFANVKTTRGYTLIANNSGFEKAYTRFLIRYPKTQITRDMLIDFNGKTYTIEYLNNVDEANTMLEIQAKEVTH
jgi:SPP1 family predicted phage head-tail adaptor